METATSKIYCLRDDDRQGDGRPGQPGQPGTPIGEEQEKQGVQPKDAIYCKACGQAVTDRDREIAVQGSHAHTFFNPAGVVFELGCFSVAPGCHRAGEATSDFTWFAGYHWRFAFCRRCNSHLGWVYEMGEHSFYGLIFARLKE